MAGYAACTYDGANRGRLNLNRQDSFTVPLPLPPRRKSNVTQSPRHGRTTLWRAPLHAAVALTCFHPCRHMYGQFVLNQSTRHPKTRHSQTHLARVSSTIIQVPYHYHPKPNFQTRGPPARPLGRSAPFELSKPGVHNATSPQTSTHWGMDACTQRFEGFANKPTQASPTHHFRRVRTRSKSKAQRNY